MNETPKIEEPCAFHQDEISEAIHQGACVDCITRILLEEGFSREEIEEVLTNPDADF